MSTPARLKWFEISPPAFQAMLGVGASFKASTLGTKLIDLVFTRVSQINGCAFCLDMHVRDLRRLGEDWQRINSLATWREAELFDARERAALGWAESLTHLATDHGPRDAAYEAVQAQFDEREIVDLSVAIAQINAWNRINVGMRSPVVKRPLD